MDKRVVVVDTSNEIAGDGDIPHPGIGRARRMQVKTPTLQHAVMIEAVENHMPEVIVIDEIGTELEAAAARTIAERGVQLIGTAHGNNLDNLMLNPTLSDLIGGIQTVTLGDDEARRRRTQKSVLERKAPPTFEVVVEIADRDRVAVHADVAETIDALLRGDALAPEMRWRDEGGVHRTRARPRPGPQQQLPGERFGGLVASGMPGWRPEPGWRPARGELEEGVARSGVRVGATGWRRTRSRTTERGWGAASGEAWPTDAQPGGSFPGGSGPVFISRGIADRGPLERGTPPPEARARDAREFERQAEWRASAERALTREVAEADEAATGSPGEAPPAASSAAAPPLAPAAGPTVATEADASTAVGSGAGRPGRVAPRLADDGAWTAPPRAALSPAPGTSGSPLETGSPRWVGPVPRDAARDWSDDAADEPVGALAEEEQAVIRLSESPSAGLLALEPISLLPFGISRKRMEQAIRDLQLPVVIVREPDEADVVVTLRNLYKQKSPVIREAEMRGLPIYVLKSNTVAQMQACLTNLFVLDIDPHQAALREVEEAIGLVRSQARPVELSPQNAFVRRLQHQAADAANLVSRSRGREPFRRVRVYPEKARAWH
jgi:hypothetical protein